MSLGLTREARKQQRGFEVDLQNRAPYSLSRYSGGQG